LITVLGRLIVPLMLVALSVPLIYQIVPRNRFYGFRTRYTMSSDQVWYRANKMCGIALLVAGILWLALALVLPNTVTSTQLADRLVRWFGIGSLTLALLISTWLIYRRPDGR
jgi:uncharacterized membrane protein